MQPLNRLPRGLRPLIASLAVVLLSGQVAAQQVQLPQDLFGQLAIGVNTRISTQFGRDLSGSVEGMVGTHRAFRSWYRPSAVSGGVTRLFAQRCRSQRLGDCLQATAAIPWISVLTGASRSGPYGTIRVMGGLGAVILRGDLATSTGAALAFETRLDYLVFPTPQLGATFFLRNLTVNNPNAAQANGIALGIGLARRSTPPPPLVFPRD